MSDVLLIEEAGNRAIDRLRQLLTLVPLAFEEGEARARSMLAERIIDPVASACFGEARELLLRPDAGAAQLFAAVMALDMAASREPNCYGAVLQVIRRLVFDSLEDVVMLELATAGSNLGRDGLAAPRRRFLSSRRASRRTIERKTRLKK